MQNIRKKMWGKKMGLSLDSEVRNFNRLNYNWL